MRVLLVGPVPLDPSRASGGVETSFSTLLSGLARLPDLDVHVVTFVPELGAPPRTEVHGIPVEYLRGTRRLGYLTLHVAERRRLRRVLDSLRPDLVHAQDTLRYGFVCLKTAGRIPVVVSVHGIVREEVNYALRRMDRLQIGLAGVATERYCIRNARYLTEPTRYPEEYFGDEIRGRIWDVGNPIAERFFSIDPAPEPGRILYTGAFIPRKRLLDLVDAMPRVLAEVPAATLRAAGSEADIEYADRVRARVQSLGLGERVTVLHSLSFEDLLEEYRRAAVLVLPSGAETSPMVIGEAMAARVPVVATRVGGVRYLVDEGVTGHIVEPGDVQALAARIAGILGDPRLGTAMGVAGRAKADRSFRVGAVADRVRAVYEEALQGGDVSGYDAPATRVQSGA